MNTPVLQIVGAAVAGLSLSYTISVAVLKGIFTGNEGFFRTPKMAGRNPLLKSLFLVKHEFIMLFVMSILALILWMMHRGEVMMLDLQLWFIVICIQCIPYVAAVSVALLSASQPEKTVSHL